MISADIPDLRGTSEPREQYIVNPQHKEINEQNIKYFIFGSFLLETESW